MDDDTNILFKYIAKGLITMDIKEEFMSLSEKKDLLLKMFYYGYYLCDKNILTRVFFPISRKNYLLIIDELLADSETEVVKYIKELVPLLSQPNKLSAGELITNLKNLFNEYTIAVEKTNLEDGSLVELEAKNIYLKSSYEASKGLSIQEKIDLLYDWSDVEHKNKYFHKKILKEEYQDKDELEVIFQEARIRCAEKSFYKHHKKKRSKQTNNIIFEKIKIRYGSELNKICKNDLNKINLIVATLQKIFN